MKVLVLYLILSSLKRIRNLRKEHVQAHFKCSQITGIAVSVPGQKFALTQLADIWGEKEIKQIMAATGIYSVRIAPKGMTTSDLCFDAAKNLFAAMDVTAESVDGIVFVTQTPDYIAPPTSPLLQNRLGLPTTCVAFDINYGCSGYIYGLLQANLLINANTCTRVLVCTGDINSAMISPRDRSVRMVFGDAGSATLVEQGADETYFEVGTDGSIEYLVIPAGGGRNPSTDETKKEKEYEAGNFRSLEHLHMDGAQVMNFALQRVPSVITSVLKYAGWDKESVGTFALHQANKFLLEYLRKKMRVKPEAVPFSSSMVGNTGPASIPLMLSLEAQRLGEQKRLKRVVMCGFGVGLSWGAVTANLESTKILGVGELETTLNVPD